MEDYLSPAEFASQNPNLSDEEMNTQYTEKYGKPIEPTPTPDPEPTPTPDPQPTDVDPIPSPEPTPNPEPTPEPTPTFDYSSYGVSSDTELRERLQRVQTLEQEYEALKQDASILEHVKNPFANDTIMQLNNFVSKTGISDLSFAAEVLSTTNEALKNDPLKAIVINEALNDPQLAALGMDRIRQYVAVKNGVNLEEYGQEGYDLPVSLQVDGLKALTNIEKKREEFVNKDNFFVTLQNQAQEQQRLASEKSEKWNLQLPNIRTSVKQITKEVDTQIEGIGKIQLSLAVSEQEVQSALDNLKSVGALSMMNPDEKGVATLRQAVEDTLRNSKMELFMQNGFKAVEGKIRERLVAEKHNLAPVTERPAPAPITEVVSPAEAYLNSLAK